MEENLPINYFCKDYLSEDIGSGYDAVICIYCDFGALIPTDKKILLDNITSYHSHAFFSFQVISFEGFLFLCQIDSPFANSVKTAFLLPHHILY